MAIGETAVMPDYESGEIQPAAALLEEISPEEAGPGLPDAQREEHLEAIVDGIKKQSLPIEIFEGSESETSLLIRYAKYRLTRALRPDINNREHTELRKNISKSDSTGEDFLKKLLESVSFRALALETIEIKAIELGLYPILWPEEKQQDRLSQPFSEDWKKGLEAQRQKRRIEMMYDMADLCADFKEATGRLPKDHDINEIIRLHHLQPLKRLYGELFEDEADFRGWIKKRYEYLRAQKQTEAAAKKKLAAQMLSDIQDGRIPKELFLSETELGLDDKLIRYARYLVADHFIVPEIGDEDEAREKEVQEMKIKYSAADYSNTKHGGKDFYRHILNLSPGINRGSLQVYASMKGLTNYIEPQIRANHLNWLKKLGDRAQARVT